MSHHQQREPVWSTGKTALLGALMLLALLLWVAWERRQLADQNARAAEGVRRTTPPVDPSEDAAAEAVARARFRKDEVGLFTPGIMVESDDLDAGLFPETTDYESSDSLELAMRRLPGQLVGWVSDQRSAPVADAQVTLRFDAPKSAKSKPRPGPSAASAANGLFAINNIPPGLWIAVGEKQGFAKDVVTGLEIAANERHEPISLQLRPELRITGTVTAAGKPVADAFVVASRDLLALRSGGDAEAVRLTYSEARTSADGAFALGQLPSGTVLLRAEAAGFARKYVSLEISDASTRQDIALDPEATITGAVRDSRDLAVEGAELKIVRVGAPAAEEPWGLTKSGKDGAFRFGQLPAGMPFDLTATAKGFAPFGPVRLAGGSANNIIRLSAGGAIEGTVSSFDSGLPFPGITVVATTEQGASSVALQTRTTSEGRYRIAQLPTGAYTVTVANEAYTTVPKTGVAVPAMGTTKGVDFAVYPGLLIRGNTTDGDTGERLSAVEVTLRSRIGPALLTTKKTIAVSTETGAFEFTNLPQGLYTLTGARKGYITTNESDPQNRVSLLREATLPPVDLKLYRGGTVDGVVYDPAGTAQGGALVQLFAAPASPGRIPGGRFQTTSEPDGSFSFEGLPLDSDLQLYASAFVRGLAKSRSPLMAVTKLRPQADTQINLQVGQALTVRCVDGATNGLAKIKLTLAHSEFADDPVPKTWIQETGIDGTAVFPNLIAGGITVTAEADGYLTESRYIAMEAEPRTLTMTLKGARRLVGRVIDDAGDAFGRGSVTASPERGATGSGSSPIAADGVFRIATLGEGSFALEVNASKPTATGTRRIKWTVEGVVPNNGVGELLITVPSTGVLTGKVLAGDTMEAPPRFTVLLEGTLTNQPELRPTFRHEHTFQGVAEFKFDNLPPGEYRVRASAPDHLPVVVDAINVESPGAVTAGTMRLPAGGSVTVRALSADTGEPIARAVLTLRPEGPSATTDAEGKATITPVSPGLYALEARHADYLFASKSPVRVQGKAPTDAGAILMRPGGRVSGTVYRSDGTGYTDVYVESRESTGSQIKGTYSGLQGEWEIRGLAPGSHVLTFTVQVRHQFLSKSLETTIALDKDAVEDLVLAADASLQGLLVGGPSVDPTRSVVTLYPLRADSTPITSNAIPVRSFTGDRFFVSELIEGNYLIAVQAPKRGGGSAWWAGTARVLDKSSQTVVQRGNLLVNGRVLARDGETPIANQEVRLDLISAPQSGSATLRRWWQWSVRTDSAGKFEFSGLPRGTYSIAAHANAGRGEALAIVTLDGERVLTTRDLKLQ